MNHEIGYPLIEGMDCGCKRIMNDSCWGRLTLNRIEYCEKHCPECKYNREHPDSHYNNALPELKNLLDQIYAHTARRHAIYGEQ